MDENSTDRAEVYLAAEEMNIIAKEGQMKADGRKTRDLIENEYLILRDRCDPKHTLLARFRDGMFRRLYTLSDSCRVAPRNISQHFAIDALMAPPEEIPLVILQGEAGTAKTFLTVACGMDQMVDRRFPMPEIRFSFLPLCGKMGKKMHGRREGRRCSER